MKTSHIREKLSKMEILVSKQINMLIGQKCWGLRAGKPNFHSFTLHFGNKIQREKVINNPKLEFQLDRYVGEYIIQVECEWRLNDEQQVITGSKEPNDLDGPMVTGLKNIIGKEITKIDISEPCGDLLIEFKKLQLRIFSLYTGNENNKYCFQDEENWSIYYNRKMLLKNLKGCITKENLNFT